LKTCQSDRIVERLTDVVKWLAQAKEEAMLLLARKAGQSVVIDGNIRVTVDRVRGRVVRLKVEAPREIQVDREEVWNRRVSENQHVFLRGG
jgi:carbon storage regulator